MLLDRNKKNILVSCAIILAITAGSCKYDNVEELYPANNDNYNCDTIFPSYSKDIVPIIITYCTDSVFGSCHQDNSTNSHMNNYVDIKFLVDGGHIQEHVIKTHSMPPPNSLGPQILPLSLIRKIDCWINHGTVNN